MMAQKIPARDVFRYLIIIIFLVLIGEIYIEAILGIRPQTIAGLYKDAFIFLILFLFICTSLLKYKKIINTEIDFLMFLFICYCVFEILLTYWLKDSLLLGIYKFRMYFLVYVLYFPFVYILRSYKDIELGIFRFIFILSIILFIWAIVECILVNTGVLPFETIASFLKISLGHIDIRQYGIGPGKLITRGYGILGSVITSGVLYVILFTIFLPSILLNKDKHYRSYILLGIAAIVLSFCKTAWLLLLFMLFVLSIALKSRNLKTSFVILTGIVLYMYLALDWFRESINQALEDVPITASRISDFLNNNLVILLFGVGYEFSGQTVVFTTTKEMSVIRESGIFFWHIFGQFGILGLLLYSLIFLIVPIRIAIKKPDPIIKGAALAVVVAGLSSIHLPAIFGNGVNVVTCFLLAYLSFKSPHFKKNALGAS
ncbi:MAG: hypothetical protein AMJ43_08050 [Coxiella sp. DG_40]|nr:MAG: hypothetical protein AMJ43_08050 [Coxiella sp. DG_40]